MASDAPGRHDSRDSSFLAGELMAAAGQKAAIGH
jgi:hypothetical protein